MATITKKILDKRDEIIDAGIKAGELGVNIAEDLGDQATDAILNGKNSPQWRKFMRNFASNKAQLLRLLGRDPVFNANSWSERALAYIPSNPMCTITTIDRPNIINTVEKPNVGTLNFMDADMIAGLEDIDNVTGPEEWFEDFVAEEVAEVSNLRNMIGKILIVP